MDVLADADQAEITALAREFLTERLGPDQAHAVADGRAVVDAALLGRAAELGWFGLGLPESRGGAGYGLLEEIAVFREIGRAVSPGPLLPMVLAARIAVLGGADSQAEGLLSGTLRAAWAEPVPGAATVTAERVSGRFASFDPERADVLVVVTPEVAVLVPAPDGSAAVPSVDPTISTLVAELEVAPLAVLPADADPVYLRGLLLSAAALVGSAQRTTEMAVEHAGTREAFGRPIGTYQAIKHRCADMWMRTQAADAHLVYAALALDSGGKVEADLPGLAHGARSLAAEAAARNGEAVVQVHGAMGYTWEHDSGLHIGRAEVLRRWFGGPAADVDAVLASVPLSDPRTTISQAGETP
ncbi:acyl-CoA dehydrogenase family protein [Pseudonocardia pini]|uniref:acyl-CoA dehydrogenase family protein n=1 Tax=Pseudonocardia pini TaxID=2758030 RepID=UPI0015F0D8BD|nr:acyl-CoA dehydrogenase family protein [Pseudonocardia pini]